MLAVVKTPHTEIALSGDGAEAVLDVLRQNFPLELVDDDTSVPIRETDWWQQNRHRILAGARHRAGLTQHELAKRSGIRQSTISEYERGKRRLTLRTAMRLAEALGTEPERLLGV